MKKLFLLFTLLVVAIAPVFAQGKGQDKDHKAMRKEIMDFKIKFLAQEMELNEEQQKKFNTLYRQMSEEKGVVFHELHALKKKIGKDANDAEYEAYTRAASEAKEKEAEIDRRYDAKFAEFLSAKQIYKMKAAEEKFRQKMHEMRGKKKDKDKKTAK